MLCRTKRLRVEELEGRQLLSTVSGIAAAAVANLPPIAPIPYVSQPGYLVPVTDPNFGTSITRIVNNPGQSVTTPNDGTGTWSTDAHHHYSKIEPWNSNGTLIEIENTSAGGGNPRILYLDGKTCAVKFGKPSNYFPIDDRWNPSPQHPDEEIAVTNGGRTLEWFNVVTDTVTRSWSLPYAVDGIGSYEGNPSADGRYILLNQNDPVTHSYHMFLVDMNPQAPYAPYPASRIGPAYDLWADGQFQPGWKLDWASVSPSGKYVVVQYSDGNGNAGTRVFDVNPVTLALTPHVFSWSYSNVMGSAAKGFIWSMGHADMALNPFDHHQDYIIGVNGTSNYGAVPGVRLVPGATGIGQIVMVRLSDGAVTSLTNPNNEARASHVSTRNVDRPGWVYVTYHSGGEAGPGQRFADEIVAIRLDGSGKVEQFAHYHSTDNSYNAQAHAVPSQDGTRIIFQSNWALDGNGVATDYQDYVIGTGLLMGRVAVVAQNGTLAQAPQASTVQPVAQPNQAPAPLQVGQITGGPASLDQGGINAVAWTGVGPQSTEPAPVPDEGSPPAAASQGPTLYSLDAFAALDLEWDHNLGSIGDPERYDALPDVPLPGGQGRAVRKPEAPAKLDHPPRSAA
jgi:hypothetical protein